MKVNDKVICIYANSKNARLNGQPKIYKHQIYTVEEVIENDEFLNVIKTKEIEAFYSSELFLTVKQYRKLKLKKLFKKML